MAGEISGYQLIKPGDKLISSENGFKGPEVRIPGLGHVSLFLTRSPQYQQTKQGLMFLSAGELTHASADYLRERDYYQAIILHSVAAGEERSPLVSRITHSDSGVHIAAISRYWQPEVGESPRSLLKISSWELMAENPQRFAWFTDPQGIGQLSKFRYSFS